MAKIILKVQADTSAVAEALNTLKKDIQALSGIKLNIQGLDALQKMEKGLLSVAAAQARKATAEAKAAQAASKLATETQKSIQAHERTSQAMEKTAQAQEKTAQSANALAIAREKTYQAEERTSQAMERTAQGANNLSIQQEKTAQTANRLAIEEEKTARATQQAGSAAQSASGGFSALNVMMGNIAARAFHAVISKIRQAFRDALNEMKNVDTELTNISKVSGKTGEDLAAIGDKAYDTASKYGVAASEYLSAVYDMQKAGMGDQAESMGELAIKTMLVGDTTKDVASKFLLASNAAWKLNGDMGSLSKIVDEADYINNNYATTLDKLASGMPIVASVAAQAGMSAEETMAALGTITTVTQESGTKAATALRALILNIEGQVGKYVTEEGEEFEVTAESVKSLQGLLEKYAKTEMDAAKASGELINPMTAIKALFEGMANEDLSDADLFMLLTSMGGKLRTNQLTALVQNYGLFDEMLQRIGKSAGTADSEIALMLESWQSKVNILKNTWTELFADVVSTDTIKNGIDMLTDFLDTLDEAVKKINNPFYDRDNLVKQYKDAKDEIAELESRAGNLNSIEQYRLESLRLITAELEKQIQLESEAAAKKLNAELLTPQMTGYDENGYVSHVQTLRGDQAQYNNLYGNYWEAAGAFTQTGDVTAFQESLRGIVRSYAEYYDNLVKVRDAGVELSDAQTEFISQYEDIDTAAQANITNIRDMGDGLLRLYDENGKLVAITEDRQKTEEAAAHSTQQALDEQAAQTDLFSQMMEGLGELVNRVVDANTEYAEMIWAVDNAGSATTDLTDAEGDAASAAGNIASAASGIAPQVDAARSAVMKLVNALQQAAQTAGSISVGGIGIDQQAEGTKNAPGGPTLVNELGPELISENGRAYIANGGKPGIVNLSHGAIVLTAEETRAALSSGKAGRKINAAVAGQGGRTGGSSSGSNSAVVAGAVMALQLAGVTPAGKSHGNISTGGTISTKKTGSGTGGGGSGGGGKKKKKKKSLKTYAEELSDLLSNLDKQAKLADNEGEYEKEAQVWEKAQEAIKEMVDRYRAAGYAEDSDEILDLLNKNYDYADKQLKLYQDKWSELTKALKADTDAQELANKLAEKELAVQEARESLENAQKQRNIRIYNAETGQWEWVADQKNIDTAQKNLDKAEKNYADELKDQAIKELEAMKDTITDLNDVVLGPALSAVALMAESSDEFQNFARALNAVYGVGTFLASTEGNPNAIDTVDSHDTVYTFGDIVLTEEQASTTTLAQLAQMLNVLNITE